MTAEPDGTATRIDQNVADKVLAEIDPGEVTEFLRDLVRIPTVNPPGDVRAAVHTVAKKLEDAGYVVRTVGDVPEKPNLIAEYGKDSPVLCCNAHLDVVPIGERAAWRHDPFGADFADGRIYGRGAGDDKASVTAQVMAGVAIARSGIKLNGRLVINEVADEEIGGPHGTALVVSGGHIRPDYVIVGEQTLNRVCLGEKGGAGTIVTIYGRAAHGALPWEGANAIEAMGRVITALREELWPRLAERMHPYFHHSSASINLIEGGVKQNVVADRCQIYIDRRLVPGESPDEAQAEIRDIAERVCRDMPGLRVEISPHHPGRAAILSELSTPAAQAMLAANIFLGLNTEPTGFSMATDGRFFAEAGWPAIIYGPGDPSLAHIPDEWVGADEVVTAAKAYALGAIALLGHNSE